MRRSGMRNRIAALAAMSAFAIGIVGIAVVAGRSGGSLERLPALAGGRSEAAADMAAMGGAYGEVEYVVEGALPDLPLEAPAFRLPDGDDRSAVARLAAALGVRGEPRKRGSTYTVADGTRSLTVETTAGVPWYLGFGCPDAAVSSDGSVSAMGCAVATPGATPTCGDGAPDRPECESPAHDGGGAPGATGTTGARAEIQPCPPCPPNADCLCGGHAEPDPGGAQPPTKVEVPPPTPPTPPADVPDRAEAERIAREVFSRLELPLDTLALDGGEWGWQATVSPPVERMPVIGGGHTLTIGSKGEITGGNGHLRAARRIGDYPLAGVQAGLDRLREGNATGPMPLVAADAREPAVDLPAQAEKQTVTLTGVHLALQQVDDVLVPVYAFEIKGGGTVAAPAVVDRYLKQPDVGRPEPAVTETGSASCGASGSVGNGATGNQPLTVEVCVEPAKVKVGQPVTFRVRAVDPDAPILDIECGSPVVAFGDGNPATRDCGVACTTAKPSTPKKTEPKAGELAKAYTHAYDEPGTYTATFTFHSGACDEWSSQGEGVATVVVVG